jgi:hypothetical protein
VSFRNRPVSTTVMGAAVIAISVYAICV